MTLVECMISVIVSVMNVARDGLCLDFPEDGTCSFHWLNICFRSFESHRQFKLLSGVLQVKSGLPQPKCKVHNESNRCKQFLASYI